MFSSQNMSLNRAQQHFTASLLTLMQEKPYREITVAELSERAQYDRRTYYRYFDSLDDVLCLYCASLLKDMADGMMRKGPLTPETGFLAYFEFWDRHRDFLTLLDRQELLFFLGEKQDQLLYKHVGLVVHNDLPDELSQVPVFSQYAFYFTLGGLWTTLTLWIRTGMRQTPSELTKYVLDTFSEMEKFIDA